MPKFSPRDAVKVYAVSRATLMRALADGKISAEKTEAGHWQIDAAELSRIYVMRAPQKTMSRAEPDQIGQGDTPHETAPERELELRLARAEAALDAEREKTALLERHLDDLRRMLPAPDTVTGRKRGWWPW